MRLSTLSILALLLVLFSCKTTKELDTSDQKNEMTIEKARTVFINKVTVTAKEGMSAKSFEKKYKEYELQYRGMSSKSQNTMAFSFNDNLISSPALIELLKNDKNALNATPLRKAEQRTTVSKSGGKGVGKLTK